MKIPIKTGLAVQRMRESCVIAATVLENLKPLVKPGVTTQDLEEAGREFIARLGDVLDGMREELNYEIEKIYIDGNPDLEKLYGEQVPVIHIDGNHHDFFRVDPERFKSSLEKHRQRQ